MTFVRLKGLEPPRLSALDPKSSAATNYATTAIAIAKVITFLKMTNFFLKKYHFIYYNLLFLKTNFHTTQEIRSSLWIIIWVNIPHITIRNILFIEYIVYQNRKRD